MTELFSTGAVETPTWVVMARIKKWIHKTICTYQVVKIQESLEIDSFL